MQIYYARPKYCLWMCQNLSTKLFLSLFFTVGIELVAVENVKLNNDVIDKTGEPQTINNADRILEYWQYYWPWR